MTISYKRKPTWARELVQDGEKYGSPKGSMRQVNKPKTFSSYMDLMCDLLETNPLALKNPFRRKNGQMP
jgi:hypothetical protein